MGSDFQRLGTAEAVLSEVIFFRKSMMMVRFFFGVICVFLLMSQVTVFAEPPAKVIEITDLAGETQTPLTVADRKASVLFFLLPDCPVSNAYAPEIKRISAEYARQNITSFIIYVDPALDPAGAKKHAADFGYETSLICDTNLQLVEATGVTIAPEVAVMSPQGKRLYRGRIDNLYAGLGKRRPQATHHDLRAALDAILSGKPVEQETTTAIGCFIEKRTPKATRSK